MAVSDLHFQTATDLAPLIKARKISPVELVRTCLAQIEKVNPKVNAFLTVLGDRAMQQAQEAEREIWPGVIAGRCTVSRMPLKTSAPPKAFAQPTDQGLQPTGSLIMSQRLQRD